MNKLIEQIKRHESYRKHVYRCSAGKSTIGYGYNLSANPLHLSGVEISYAHTNGMIEAEAERLLIKMVDDIIKQLHGQLPWWSKLSGERQAVLVNMAYNIGVAGVLGFKNTLHLIERGDYTKASVEMMNSKWAGQVKGRAVELAEQMKTGKYVQ
jgi:lysozyme